MQNVTDKIEMIFFGITTACSWLVLALGLVVILVQVDHAIDKAVKTKVELAKIAKSEQF